jgi:eukaryotic-like serine/threonine-protein kinase
MHHAPDALFLDFQTALAGRYSLERELGRGGMGVVYLAREVRLDRPVAIKLLPPAKAANTALRDRFLREARTAAKLSHPHIIPIHAVDEAADFVFFAMSFIEGETLTDRVRQRGPLAPSEAARVLREVAWALAYAHSQGVIHRDVKPDNILLETNTGRALVADFGIAGLVKGAAGLDGGEVIGTPEFMSPEQALGERVDARSDLYSLGVVGFFALTGKLVFEGDKATEILAKHVTEIAPTVASVSAGVPRKLGQTIDRCLAKTPDERFQTGEDLAEQLALALEHRKDLPVALRVFVKRHGQMGGAVMILYAYGLSIIAVTVGMSVPAGWGALAGWGTFVVGLGIGPLAFLFHRARGLLKLGFGLDDVAVAFKTEIDRGREERAFEYGHLPSVYERVMRVLAVAGLSVAALAAVAGVIGGGFSVTWLGPVLGWSLTVGMGSGALALLRLDRRRDITTTFWSWLWKSRFGRWIFRNAARRTTFPTRLGGATHRPTELSLGMAAERLFEELPKVTRHQLRDLPDVVHRLESDAQRMRARLEQLNDALGDVKGSGTGDSGLGKPGEAVATRHDRVVADLRVERDLVQQRMADAVAALETIRLNLLRLHAGSGSVQSVTTDLGLAKEVAAEVDRLLQGQREIEEML